MIKINEIYPSIQGESSLVGIPTVFVRTSGCPLRCSYCDSSHAFFEGKKMTVQDIMNNISSFNINTVCLTGGEPLVQPEIKDLMTLLCDKGFNVSVETSGAVSCQGVDSRVKKVVDIKTPDSGAPDSFLTNNLEFMTENDEFKFVICSENDFTWASDLERRLNLTSKCTVLMSPSHDKICAKWLAEKILSQNPKVRLQIQLHKYIWSDRNRGI